MVHTAQQMQQDNPELFENLREASAQLSQENPQPEDKSKDKPPPKEQ